MSKPNILLVQVDQLAYNVLSTHSGTAQTPNIDTLASQAGSPMWHLDAVNPANGRALRDGNKYNEWHDEGVLNRAGS